MYYTAANARNKALPLYMYIYMQIVMYRTAYIRHYHYIGLYIYVLYVSALGNTLKCMYTVAVTLFTTTTFSQSVPCTYISDS